MLVDKLVSLSFFAMRGALDWKPNLSNGLDARWMHWLEAGVTVDRARRDNLLFHVGDAGGELLHAVGVGVVEAVA